MPEMIAFCGIDCSQCKGYIATKKADPKMKKAVAAEWSKQYGHPFRPKDVNCLGCAPGDGPHLAYCGMCEIRKCCTEKMLQDCAHCAGYSCAKLAKFQKKAPEARKNLEQIRNRINKG